MKGLHILFAALGICINSPVVANQYYKSEFMDISEAQKRWGRLKFDSKKFQNGGNKSKVRAQMAVDFVLKKLFIGKPLKEVRVQLGTPDGYMFSENIIGYQIFGKNSANSENWQVVFIPGSQFSKVKAVKIHKKCCYKPPEWLTFQ